MEEVVINSGDTAWMLISTGLVVLMIPGLALFYGGMVRVKSVLNMMMMSLVHLQLCLFFGLHLDSRLFSEIQLAAEDLLEISVNSHF